ncbi:phosphatidylinositol glycan class L [Eremomyces bilateralis CBS 781.70]|uniref:N-acetylglucosaminylphosphatidylinositol deacetylase n=1 Tax=Eremomyces bilateralis CBS 781.70 TaxID=1392243 RepID=A0A6G1GDF4_9PEZI|nr:phosphatidylinositol glycan class L [Eremomyces bilateralis CBS 781.70]KAF1815899.1 phosphatidylinositol glycan class L [Eremomyces bilateralis CBS 781.70]
MRGLFWAALPLFLMAVWIWAANLSRTHPILTNQRIGLLIAHPDDEVMFFAPTLLALTDPGLGNHVQILCMSSGDADGQGATRKKELVESALALGIRSSDDVLVVDEPDFPDSMTIAWNPHLLARRLGTAFAPNRSTSSSGSLPKPPIDSLITFDAGGVSSHPNHRACHTGATTFIHTSMRERAGWGSPVELYTLTSVNLWRKYVSFVDAPWTMLLAMRRATHESGSTPSSLVFMSDPAEYWRARQAMTQAHKSQMRWFRYGWITLSRYMVVNDLRRENE